RGAMGGESDPIVELRRYEPEDADAVWALHNRALEGTGAHPGNGDWDRDVRDPIRHYLDRGGEFLVCLVGGALAAMGAYLPDDATRSVEIKRMRVEPAMHRRGLGMRVLSELERRARDHGYEWVTLETTKQQIAAQALYARAGYRVTGVGRVGVFEVVRFEKAL